MNRYAWVAIQHDGTMVQRWNADGTENAPSKSNTKEFHLLPAPDALPCLRPFSLFLKPEQLLIFNKRRHVDGGSGGQVEDLSSVVYVVGYEEDLGFAHFASYAALLPDGRVEWSSSLNHITRHERNLEVHPLQFYETWGEDV